VDFVFFTKQLINGLTLGGLYALIAVGYTMVYGIIKLINFAHGEIYMVGGFVGLLLVGAGIPFPVAVVLSMAVCAVLGVTIDRVAYQPLRNSSRLAALITAIGMSLFLQNLAMAVWGSQQHTFPDLNPQLHVTVVEKTEGSFDAAAVNEKLLGPIQAQFEALRDGNFDAVQSLTEYHSQRQVVERLEKDPGADTQELAKAREALEKTRVATPIPQSWSVIDVEGGKAIDVQYPLGVQIAEVQSQVGSILLEVRYAAGAVKKQVDAEVVKIPHYMDEPVGFLSSSPDTPPAERITVSWKVLLTWLLTLASMIGLHFLVQNTRMGKAMRACALDKDTAALMGVDVNAIIRYTFMIGSALAALAGILFPYVLGSVVFYRMGFFIGVIAFGAAVLGGIGNIKGAFLGGLAIGLIESLSRAYLEDWTGGWLGSDYYQAVIFLVLFVIIIVKPTGLLGSQSVERA
jgi:branched-chain amino acid transport system permease protein